MRVDTRYDRAVVCIIGNIAPLIRLALLAVLRHYYAATFIINHIHPVCAGQLLADNTALPVILILVCPVIQHEARCLLNRNRVTLQRERGYRAVGGLPAIHAFIC